MDEMQLGPRAVTLDGVVGGSMDMPALEIDGLIIKTERRVPSPNAVFSLDSKRRTVSPVEEVTGNLIGIIPFLDEMFQGQALLEGQWNG
jgi:hypothetical protein